MMKLRKPAEVAVHILALRARLPKYAPVSASLDLDRRKVPARVPASALAE